MPAPGASPGALLLIVVLGWFLQERQWREGATKTGVSGFWLAVVACLAAQAARPARLVTLGQIPQAAQPGAGSGSFSP